MSSLPSPTTCLRTIHAFGLDALLLILVWGLLCMQLMHIVAADTATLLAPVPLAWGLVLANRSFFPSAEERPHRRWCVLLALLLTGGGLWLLLAHTPQLMLRYVFVPGYLLLGSMLFRGKRYLAWQRFWRSAGLVHLMAAPAWFLTFEYLPMHQMLCLPLWFIVLLVSQTDAEGEVSPKRQLCMLIIIYLLIELWDYMGDGTMHTFTLFAGDACLPFILYKGLQLRFPVLGALRGYLLPALIFLFLHGVLSLMMLRA